MRVVITVMLVAVEAERGMAPPGLNRWIPDALTDFFRQKHIKNGPILLKKPQMALDFLRFLCFF